MHLVVDKVFQLVTYLNIGARNTHTSRIWTGILNMLKNQWIAPDVTIRPGYT